MIEAELDGKQIRDRGQLHGWLARELEFPPWYGFNLDALYDCLTDIHADTSLVIRHWHSLRENLGSYADRLLEVLLQAQEDNPRFCLKR